MKQLLRLAGYTLGACAFVVFLGFGIGSTVVAPDHALVFVDADQKVYIAPPCVPREKWMLYPHVTIGQACTS